MNDPTLLDALRRALEGDPGNGPLWAHYGRLLQEAGRDREALEALRSALAAGEDPAPLAVPLVRLLRRTDQLAEALIRAEQGLASRENPALRRELALILKERGRLEEAREHYERLLEADPAQRDPELDPLLPAPGGPARVGPEPLSDAEWAAQFDWDDIKVGFDDVAGLEEVKRQIRLRILAPFRDPELFRAYQRQAGGGLLLYGPPGCGKTFMARATAGELGARFLSVGIHEVLDKFWGESERMIHALFEEARAKCPSVLFFDEFDALGTSRGKSDSQFFRTLANQLLQEMDGLHARNEGLLLFAATNMPWQVDPAFRRPGRFDRVLFIPPPDDTARLGILRARTAKLPGGPDLPHERLLAATRLFSGADVKALCDQAAEYALERSLEMGRAQALSLDDFTRASKCVKSSILEWLATARNHARYANEGGRYDELVAFLKSVGRW